MHLWSVAQFQSSTLEGFAAAATPSRWYDWNWATDQRCIQNKWLVMKSIERFLILDHSSKISFWYLSKCKNWTFKSLSISKIIRIFQFFFIEQYKFRTTFFVTDIFDNFNDWITFFFLLICPNFVDLVEVQLGRNKKDISQEWSKVKNHHVLVVQLESFSP